MTTLAHSLDETPPLLDNLKRSSVLWLIWIACLAIGSAGIYQRVTQGHLPAGYGSYVPWGLWVALYFHGVGLAGGVFLVAAGGYIWDCPGFKSKSVLRTAIVLSTAAMIPGFMAVWFDLGHMSRAIDIFLRPNFNSMMAFNAWMYSAFLAAAAVAWWLSFRESTWLKPVLCLAGFFAILYPSQSGAFFGVVDSKPYWHSPVLPMLFLSAAVAAGTGLLMLTRWIVGSEDDSAPDHSAAFGLMRKILLFSLIAYFVFEFAEFSILLWSPSSHTPELHLVLHGPYWWVFWIVHLLIGGVISLMLLLQRAQSGWIVASFLVAVTMVSGRLNVLIPGQAVNEIKGLQEAFWHERLTYIYHATPMEYFVGLFLVAVGMAVFYAGRRINQALQISQARGAK